MEEHPLIPKHLGHLERHSLMLILASLLGHIGNYAYHFITGRFLSEVEYGLLMALFGAVNILLFPLAAFDLSLTRTIAELQKDHQESAIASLLRSWCFRLTGLVIVALVSAMVVRPFLLNFFSTENWIPLLLALLIPCLCLFLTLSGATLRGLQCFHGLAFRNGLMFLTRAGLFGSFFALGSISTSWALASHLIALLLALAVSLVFLRRTLQSPSTASPPPPILPGTLKAFPILLAFSVLMSADVVLMRALHSEELSGQFAQAATLARMILWIPLPIAQTLFPKVVRQSPTGDSHSELLRKALLYTAGLVGASLLGAWILGEFIFHLLFGHPPSPEQLGWLRGVGIGMAFLGPVYVILQYEMAQRRHNRLIPICVLALAYIGSVWIRQSGPDTLIRFLIIASALSLVTAVRALGRERVSPSDLSLSEAE